MNWKTPHRYLRLLSPFYLLILQLHRSIYEWKILVPFRPNQATLVIGNLHSGGTGKTPLAIWILLKIQNKIPYSAYVSRGYGRKTWATRLVKNKSSVAEVGDEARMLRSKLQDNVAVIVAKRRRAAFPLIPINAPVILDDAFQHWDIKSPLSILVCPHNQWYTQELVLPAGPLREPFGAADRASAVVVTKCPYEINEYEKLEIRNKLNINKNQQLFCAQETMGPPAAEFGSPEWSGKEMALIVSGIGQPERYFSHVKNSDFFNNDGNAVGFLRFGDHAPWTHKNITRVLKTAQNVHCNTLIFTEKDIARLDHLPKEWSDFSIYSIPHKLDFGNDETIFLSWLNNQWKAHGYNLSL